MVSLTVVLEKHDRESQLGSAMGDGESEERTEYITG
jgi:hypothetical protein